MTDVAIDQWENLYGSRWGKEIDAGAVAHPAKFNRKLIERIYRHALEEGWLKRGDTVIDPFGGVALGALDAMRLGMRWIGIELEPKFCILGNSNLDLWNYRYSGKLPGWGTARLIRGDSRQMVCLLNKYGGEATALAVASPPFGQSVKGGGIAAAMRGEGNYNVTTAMPSNAYTPEAQGIAEGNLSAMPTGDIDAAIASPPFADSTSNAPRPNKLKPGYKNLQQGGALHGDYGDSEGQLASMPAGDVDIAVSSPPFLQVSGGAGVKPGVAPGSILADPRMLARHSAGNPTAKGYGADPASLTNKPVGDIEDAIGAAQADLVASSPPFADSLSSGTLTYEQAERLVRRSYENRGRKFTPAMLDKDTRAMMARSGGNFGSSGGQLGSMPSGEPDAAIASPPFLEGRESKRQASSVAADKKIGGAIEHRKDAYGDSDGQMGAAPADTFWNAARDIVAQTYAVLRPGGHALFVCKNYVKGGKIVPFTDQWRRLCESVGFVCLHEHRAMVVEDHGTQKGMAGREDKRHRSEHKSFFRRLHESQNPDTRIDYESVLCLVKPE